MMNETIPNWLKQRAYVTPNRLALIDHDETISFKQLHENVLTIAQQLSCKGIQEGDHVALLLTNSVRMVEIIHALSYIGAVMVPLNIRLTPHEHCWQLKNVEATVLIHDQHVAEKANHIATQVEYVKIIKAELLATGSTSVKIGAERTNKVEVEVKETFSLDDTFSIMYTSGTTGQPKGVQHSYGNHWWSAIGSALNLGLTEQDRWLACLPFFHVGGLSILLRSVIYGIPVVIHKKFDPQAINESIIKHRVTIISVVSAMLTDMLHHLQQDRYPHYLRCVLLGGGPASQSLLNECETRHVPVFQTYGMTETASQVVTLTPEHAQHKLGSAGKPLFPVQCKIMQDGHEVEAGTVGEIVVKGPNVTKGYFKNEKATQETIVDGWLYTGDIGYFDEEGFLHVLERRNDLIVSGGENIYPAEVESTLVGHRAIKEAGVCGIEHEKWGKVPVAFVVLRDGLQHSLRTAAITEQEIIHYCRSHLASYKIPHRVYFVNELPRNASNKLLRRELLNLLK